MKSQKWAGCIITMSGERRDDTRGNLPVYSCDGFSGPTVLQISSNEASGHFLFFSLFTLILLFMGDPQGYS
jgi:hypothetical protein